MGSYRVRQVDLSGPPVSPGLKGPAYVLLCLLPLAVGFQQTTRDAPAQQVKTGTAVVSGVLVTDETTPQPVHRARVTLNSADRSVPGRTVTTDANGRFAFTQVPAGRFNLQASKPAYLTSNYGAKRPDRSGTPIAVAESQQLIGLTMKLVRGGVITGTVVDQGGRPAQGVNVNVLRFGYSVLTGERTLGQPSSGGSGTTDDRGVYRAWGLPPGDYIVMATPAIGGGRGSSGVDDIRRLDPADVRRAQQLAQAGRSGSAPAGPGSSSEPAARGPAAGGATVNYAPVFFPGATDLAQATTITLGTAEERAGIDVPLQLMPAARVEGSVTPLPGMDVRSVQITLAPGGPGALVLAGADRSRTMSSRPDANGTFSFGGVTPGLYSITAKPIAAALTSLPATSLARTAWGLAEVMVEGRDTTVTMEMQPGMTINGRVVFDGATAPPKEVAALRFWLVPPGSGGNMSAGPAGGQVDAEGKFSFTGVTPAVYSVAYSSSMPLPASANGPWALRSAVARGRDAMDVGLDVKAGDNVEWVITFSDRPTELSGVLQDPAGRPAPDYFIIVFSADKADWRPASRRIRSTRPGNDGRFSAAALPPGVYYLAATIDVDPADLNDPKFFEQLVPAAIKVTLTEGGKTLQDIRIR